MIYVNGHFCSILLREKQFYTKCKKERIAFFNDIYNVCFTVFKEVGVP